MRRTTHISVPVVILKEGDYMVAYCPALELSAYGRTEDAAKKAFEQIVHIFLEETERKGTLEKVLLSLGWSLRQKPSCKYEPPFFISNKPALQGKTVGVMQEIVRIPCGPAKRASAYAVSG